MPCMQVLAMFTKTSVLHSLQMANSHDSELQPQQYELFRAVVITASNSRNSIAVGDLMNEGSNDTNVIVSVADAIKSPCTLLRRVGLKWASAICKMAKKGFGTGASKSASFAWFPRLAGSTTTCAVDVCSACSTVVCLSTCFFASLAFLYDTSRKN